MLFLHTEPKANRRSDCPIQQLRLECTFCLFRPHQQKNSTADPPVSRRWEFRFLLSKTRTNLVPGLLSNAPRVIEWQLQLNRVIFGYSEWARRIGFIDGACLTLSRNEHMTAIHFTYLMPKLKAWVLHECIYVELVMGVSHNQLKSRDEPYRQRLAPNVGIKKPVITHSTISIEEEWPQKGRTEPITGAEPDPFAPTGVFLVRSGHTSLRRAAGRPHHIGKCALIEQSNAESPASLCLHCGKGSAIAAEAPRLALSVCRAAHLACHG